MTFRVGRKGCVPISVLKVGFCYRNKLLSFKFFFVLEKTNLVNGASELPGKWVQLMYDFNGAGPRVVNCF
jgi:hypothetical protein